MMERFEASEGFGVLDGVALVMGAAVASVHIRTVIRDGLTNLGWILVWGTFSWVALTATGPFLFLVRRFVRKLPRYPKIGDALWAVLGLPWFVTAVLRSTRPTANPQHEDLLATGLGLGLATACLVAISVVWTTWVMVPPEQAARTASSPWTNRVGLFLAVAWPIQCGIGLVVTG